MQREYISCANTAKLVRSALAESFPGIKFSVRSSIYSGGASIDISWIDGPTSSQVKSVSDHFEGSYFDGMIDYKGCVYHTLDGQPVRFGANFIFESREYSDALLKRAIDAIVTGYGGCDPITVEGYRNGDAHTWRNTGGCDLGRALQCWLSGNNAGADWIMPDQGMQPKPSKTLDRVKFAGSDEYGAPYGSNGYPRAA
jgi:Large polyvalent protein associated domain 29